MPSTVKAALKEPPICDVIRIVGRGSIVRYVEFELIKMAALISVGNNMNNSQIQFVATQLVELFPNESLADFKLCFSRGCIGQYGEIFRMDGIVLRKWMEQYLDEKYQVVESELVQERDNLHEHQKSELNVYEYWMKHNNMKEGIKAVPQISDESVLREGQSEPPRKPAISREYSTKEYAEQQQAKIELGNKIEALRKQHPGKSLEELKAMVTL